MPRTSFWYTIIFTTYSAEGVTEHAANELERFSLKLVLGVGKIFHPCYEEGTAI